MPTNPLVGALTPAVRQAVYLVLVGAGIVAAILKIVFDPDPYWLDKTFEVLVFLNSIGFGVAASNIAEQDPQPGPDAVEGRGNSL